jgi:hypothetical protein
VLADYLDSLPPARDQNRMLMARELGLG